MTLLSSPVTTDEPSDDRDSLTSEQAEAIAELRLDLASKLGHQCEECLIDAHVSRLLEIMGDYSAEALFENEFEAEHGSEVGHAHSAHEHVVEEDLSHRLETFQAEVLEEVEILSRSLEWDDLTKAIVVVRDSLSPVPKPAESKVEAQLQSEPIVQSRSASPVTRSEARIEAVAAFVPATAADRSRDFHRDDLWFDRNDSEVPSGPKTPAAGGGMGPIEPPSFTPAEPEGLEPPNPFGPNFGHKFESVPVDRTPAPAPQLRPPAPAPRVPTLDRQVAASYAKVLQKPLAKTFSSRPPQVKAREDIRRVNILAREAQRQRLVGIQVTRTEQRKLQPQVPKLVSFNGNKGLDRGPALRKAALTKQKTQSPWVFNPNDDPEKKRREYAMARSLSSQQQVRSLERTFTPVAMKSKEEVTVNKEPVVIVDGCKGCTGGKGCCPTDMTENFARDYQPSPEAPAPSFEQSFNFAGSSFY